MRQPLQSNRPDLVRARAVFHAMRNSAGKQIRTVVEAVAWIDKHQPELTDAWRNWVTDRAEAKRQKNPPPLLA